MSFKKQLSVIALSAGILFFIFVPVSFAQESAQTVVATSEGQLKDSQVFIKEQQKKKIAELRTLYRNQVEVYRNAEKTFQIAKAQYEQVQTLQALEEAIIATRSVMFERTKVLITYLELLEAILTDTNGIELQLKQETTQELTNVIMALKIHQETVQVAKERQEVASLADDFEPIATSYESIAYKTVSLIRIGKIQTVKDKAEIIYKDIVEEHSSQEVSTLTKSKRERAYQEIERTFKLINDALATINLDVLESSTSGFGTSFYENILGELNPLYAQLSLSLDHLSELVKL